MIRCWFFRRSISRTLDDDQTPSAELQSHLLGCPDCRSFYESEADVLKQLGHGVLAREGEAPAFLHGKIMARIHREQHGSAPLPASRVPIWSTTVAAALVLSIGFLTLSHKYRGGPVKKPGTSASVAPEPGTANNGLELPIKLPDPDSIRNWTAKWDQPLETELQAMLKDAQSAIHLLAHNFLPESAVP